MSCSRLVDHLERKGIHINGIDWRKDMFGEGECTIDFWMPGTAMSADNSSIQLEADGRVVDSDIVVLSKPSPKPAEKELQSLGCVIDRHGHGKWAHIHAKCGKPVPLGKLADIIGKAQKVKR